MIGRVHNDNVHPYTEKFHGKEIYIAPKGYVDMDFNEAHVFLGTMPGNIAVDANGIQKPESYKMLRIEKLGQIPNAPKKFVCMMDGREFHNQKDLDAYILANHTDHLVDDDAKEKLEEALAAPKRKPGRPAKGVKSDTSADRDGGETKV